MLLGVDGERRAEPITGIVGLQGSSGRLVGQHASLPLLGTRFDGGAQDHAEE